MDPPLLSAILDQAQQNNSREGVTGLLCHYDGSFLQFLEGEAAHVETVFGRIRRDQRHRDILEVHRADIATRLFPEWSMGVVRVGEIGQAQQAFCRSLRDIELAAGPAHRSAIAPILQSFRAWLR